MFCFYQKKKKRLICFVFGCSAVNVVTVEQYADNFDSFKVLTLFGLNGFVCSSFCNSDPSVLFTLLFTTKFCSRLLSMRADFGCFETVTK